VPGAVGGYLDAVDVNLEILEKRKKKKETSDACFRALRTSRAETARGGFWGGGGRLCVA
jgi:hypothetical protein